MSDPVSLQHPWHSVSATLIGVWWSLIIAFICISPVAGASEHLLMHFFAICKPSLVKSVHFWAASFKKWNYPGNSDSCVPARLPIFKSHIYQQDARSSITGAGFRKRPWSVGEDGQKESRRQADSLNRAGAGSHLFSLLIPAIIFVFVCCCCDENTWHKQF